MPRPIANHKSFRWLLLGLLCCSLGLTGGAYADPAEMAPLAARALLLDGQAVGGRLVVAGERGHILVSTDHGGHWEQQPAPTRSTLTSLYFVDERLGWAAGHDAVILRTSDGGRSWQQVYADVADERPILDLWFADARTGYAVGAYGLFLATRDGGDSWESRPFLAGGGASDEPGLADEPAPGEEVHLNQIVGAPDGRLYVAAEAGHVFRSDDGGTSWQRLEPTYSGSFFGVLPLAGESLLLYGLRGHLLFSADAGETWLEVPTASQATLNDAIRLRDGRIVLAGLAGTLLFSADGGRTFEPLPQPDRPGLARVLQAADGALVLIGTHGVRRLELPPLAAPAPVEGQP